MGDWVLRYGATQQSFGGRGSELTFSAAPEVGIGDLVTGDVQAANGDGLLMGRDYQSGGTVTFQMHVIGDTRENAMRILEDVRGVWRADSLRRTPGALAELRGDRGRSTFGRPRRFTTDAAYEWDGFLHVTADFQAVTDMWFGTARADSFQFSPMIQGGFEFPLAFPAVTTARRNKTTVLDIGGEVPTPHLVFEVSGPILNPVIEVEGRFRLAFDLRVQAGEVLRVDARPWVRTIKIGRGSRAGSLTAGSTRLRDLVLPPGEHVAVLSGVPSGAAATLTTRWRDAFTTP